MISCPSIYTRGVAQTKSQIQALLSDAHTAPRHRFGQNFMIDGNLVRLIADAGRIEPGDRIIEVGPGTGTLTEELLARGAEVIAIEIDRDLAQLLRARYIEAPRLAGEVAHPFILIEGDALQSKHALNAELLSAITSNPSHARIKLIANLPYNIASPLVIELLIAGVDELIFTVQKEVAERLRADESSDAYGPLSVMAAMLSKVEIVRTLPASVFWPPPKIDSALVRMTRDDRLGNRASTFSTFVQKVFSFRRKTLRKSFIQAGFAPAILEASQIDAALRPENLSPIQFLKLFEAVNADFASQSR